jgi:hypothetical protein
MPEVGRCSHFMRNGDKACLALAYFILTLGFQVTDSRRTVRLHVQIARRQGLLQNVTQISHARTHAQNIYKKVKFSLPSHEGMW